MSKRILVVEDDRDILMTVAELLEMEGFQTDTAGNGVEALKILNNSGALPDLIILDYMMPEMNGAELSVELQKHGPFSQIPVLLITADAQPQARQKEVGARGYVRKPIDIDHFLGAISQCLNS